MLEVALARKDHRNAMFISGSDNFIVFLGAARLSYGGDTCIRGIVNVVREWEERV